MGSNTTPQNPKRGETAVVKKIFTVLAHVAFILTLAGAVLAAYIMVHTPDPTKIDKVLVVLVAILSINAYLVSINLLQLAGVGIDA